MTTQSLYQIARSRLNYAGMEHVPIAVRQAGNTIALYALRESTPVAECSTPDDTEESLWSRAWAKLRPAPPPHELTLQPVAVAAIHEQPIDDADDGVEHGERFEMQ